MIVAGLSVSNITLLRQQHYNPQTSKFSIPGKTGNADSDGLMKSDREYAGVFPYGVRQLINAQLVQNHEYVFVAAYKGRCINPASLRKMFKGYDKSMTSHGIRNTFKHWADNSDVNEFLADRYVDHNLKGFDKAYRRYDTEEVLVDIARRYYACMTAGVNLAPRQ